MSVHAKIFLFLAALSAAASALLLAPAAHASGPEQLQAFIAKNQSIRAQFTQTVLAKSGRKPQVSQGSFVFSRPGRFRLSYEKPYVQLLVGDGEKLWVYDPDLNQVSVRKLDRALGASPATLLAGDGQLDRDFVLGDAGAKDGLEWVDARPRAKEGSFERVRIGLKDQLPQVMEVQDNFGQTTTMTFSRVERNPSLSPSLFHFVPPKGADVLKE